MLEALKTLFLGPFHALILLVIPQAREGTMHDSLPIKSLEDLEGKGSFLRIVPCSYPAEEVPLFCQKLMLVGDY